MGTVRVARAARNGVSRLALLGLAGSLGCATSSLGATDADLARGRSSTSEGAGVYAGECAGCHGRRGQGVGDAPAILGPGTLSEYPRDNPTSGVPGVQDLEQGEIDQRTHRAGAVGRMPFRNALDVYGFVTVHRSKRFKTPAAKTAHDWAVVTFLMAANGAPIPDQGLTPENAGTVTIPRK
jgi:mono/diheme cytochrome c family protein